MEVRKVRRSNQRSLEADKKVGMEEVYVCVCGGGGGVRGAKGSRVVPRHHLFFSFGL